MIRLRSMRYKLMLALAVTAGTGGVFFGGALYGRHINRPAKLMTERKLDELQQVSVIIAILEQPIQAEPADAAVEMKTFQRSVESAADFLKTYQQFHAHTVAAGLDPDGGTMEAGLLTKLDAGLVQLKSVLVRCSASRTDFSPRNNPEIRKVYDATKLVAEHLRLALIDDIHTSVIR